MGPGLPGFKRKFGPAPAETIAVQFRKAAIPTKRQV